MGYKDNKLQALARKKSVLQNELATGKTERGRELTAEEKESVWPEKLRANKEEFKQREQALCSHATPGPAGSRGRPVRKSVRSVANL